MDLKALRARKGFFIILAVFLIALSLRLTTAKYDRLLGADPWYHYKMARILLETGTYPVWEYYSRFPHGEPVLAPPGLYYLPVYLFKAISFSNISFFKIFQLLPAVFGALTIIPLYLLVRELINERTAFFSSLLLGISPAAIERGLAGYFRGEVFFVFMMLFAFYFFIYSLRDARVSLLSAFFLFLSGLFWRGWGFAFAVISATFVLGLISNYIRREDSNKLILSYVVACGGGVSLLYIFTSLFYKQDVYNHVAKVATPLKATLLFLLFIVIEILNKALKGKTRKTRVVVPLAIVFVVVLVASQTGYPQYLSNRYKTVYKTALYSPEVEALIRLPFYPWRLGIGEQDKITLPYLRYAYSTLLLLAPVGLFLLLKKRFSSKIFLTLFALSSLSLLLFQVRFTFLASPAVSLLGALALYHISMQKNRRRNLSFILLAVLIIPNAYSAISYSSNAEPFVSPELYESLVWIKENTPEDSVILSWWDYTGPILGIANRKTVTHTHPSIVSEGTALMLRTKNETRALYLVRNLREAGSMKDAMDYILIDSRIYGLWDRLQDFTPIYYREFPAEDGIFDSMLFKFYFKDKLEHFQLVYDKNGVVIYKPLYEYTKITELETDKRYYEASEEIKIRVKTRSNEVDTALLSLRIVNSKNMVVFSLNQTVTMGAPSTVSFIPKEDLEGGTYSIQAELYASRGKAHSMQRYFVVKR